MVTKENMADILAAFAARQMESTTKQAKVMLALANSPEIIEAKVLEEFFSNTSDPNLSLRVAIHEINLKLVQVGIRVEHVSAYRAIKTRGTKPYAGSR